MSASRCVSFCVGFCLSFSWLSCFCLLCFVCSSSFQLEGMLGEDPQALEYSFVFCFIWACGGCLHEKDGVDYRRQFNTWWRNEWKTIKFPSKGTIFEYYVDQVQAADLSYSSYSYSYSSYSSILLTINILILIVKRRTKEERERLHADRGQRKREISDRGGVGRLIHRLVSSSTRRRRRLEYRDRIEDERKKEDFFLSLVY